MFISAVPTTRYQDDDDPRYLEDLFHPEEEELINTYLGKVNPRDIRRAWLAPPLNPQTGIRCYHPYQAEFIKDQSRYSIFLAGLGSGKTMTGAGKSFVVASFNPFESGIIAAPVARNLRDNIFPKLRSFFDDFYKFNKFHIIRKWFKTEGRIELINGFSFIFCTFTNPEKFRGVEPSEIWADEISSAQDICGVDEERLHEMFVGRLRGGQHSKWFSLFYTTTPKGMRGVVGRFWREAVEKGDLNYSIHHARTVDNTALRPDYIESFKGQYSKKFYAQEVEAKILNLSGGYFGDVFHHQESFIRYGIDPENETWVAIDWGTSWPTALVLQDVMDNDGPISVVVHEIIDARTNEELVEKILGYLKQYGVKEAIFTPDPADARAINDLAKACQRSHLRFNPAWHIRYELKNDKRLIHYSLQRLHAAFQNDLGKRRLFLATHLRRQQRFSEDRPLNVCLGQYSLNDRGYETVKLWTHSVACLRYWILNHDAPPKRSGIELY